MSKAKECARLRQRLLALDLALSGLAFALVILNAPNAARTDSAPIALEPTRAVASDAPTKFARLEPSPTLKPTKTPVTPSATPVPSDTPTRTHTPKPKPTRTPTALAHAASVGAKNLPLTPTPNGNRACAPIPSEDYGTLPIVGAPTDRPAEQHADFNLSLRGYARADALLDLVHYDGPADSAAPRFTTLFADERIPTLRNVYQVYDWDWSKNARGGLLEDYAVTLAGFAVTRAETIRLPWRGADIGRGYEALVLYASATRLTLKYTGEDNIGGGYALYLEGICVEPRLLALYRRQDDAGRGELAALRAGQALGRANGDELGVAIRDAGMFMDPRSRKDWWQGK